MIAQKLFHFCIPYSIYITIFILVRTGVNILQRRTAQYSSQPRSSSDRRARCRSWIRRQPLPRGQTWTEAWPRSGSRSPWTLGTGCTPRASSTRWSLPTETKTVTFYISTLQLITLTCRHSPVSAEWAGNVASVRACTPTVRAVRAAYSSASVRQGANARGFEIPALYGGNIAVILVLKDGDKNTDAPSRPESRRVVQKAERHAKALHCLKRSYSSTKKRWLISHRRLPYRYEAFFVVERQFRVLGKFC